MCLECHSFQNKCVPEVSDIQACPDGRNVCKYVSGTQSGSRFGRSVDEEVRGFLKISLYRENNNCKHQIDLIFDDYYILQCTHCKIVAFLSFRSSPSPPHFQKSAQAIFPDKNRLKSVTISGGEISCIYVGLCPVNVS